MEIYKHETEELIRRFMDRRITSPQCMHALDPALAELVSDPKLRGEQLNALRDLLAANNETVMVEMERRARLDPATRPVS